MASENLHCPAVALPTSDEYIDEETSINADKITGPPTPCAACLGIIEESAEIQPQPGDETDASNSEHHSRARDLAGDNYLAAIDSSRLWPKGTTILVWYIDGYQAARDKVTQYAVEWSKYANINFKFDQNLPGNAVDSIRIKFDDPSQGHNSLLGTGSRWDLQWATHFEKRIDPRYKTAKIWPSMYLDFGPMIDEQLKIGTTPARKQELERQMRAITLHEFGHALGMVHEQLRPDLKIILKSRPEVEAYYLTHNKTWTKDTVSKAVYEKLTDKTIKMSKTPDTTSIMMYEVPKEIMGPGQKDISYNYDLSATDKSYMRDTYPGRPVVP